MSGRPRRTRVYDCNYNMGEKYYKPALDNLDRKYSGKVDQLLSPSRPKINVDSIFDEDLATARRRAEKAITEDTFFDSRGARVPKSSLGTSALDDDFDQEVQSSLNRIRASKKFTSSYKANEDDLEDQMTKVRRRAKIDLGEKLLDAAGDDESGTSIRRRALKMVTRASDDFVDPSNLTKWSKLDKLSNDESNTSSAASLRAKASKARLQDLESEMFERSEKQLARDKRSAHLKKFLAESDIETVKSERHVNF